MNTRDLATQQGEGYGEAEIISEGKVYHITHDTLTRALDWYQGLPFGKGMEMSLGTVEGPLLKADHREWARILGELERKYAKSQQGRVQSDMGL